MNRGAGYDVIIASDYMVEFLRKDNLLKPLQHDQLSVVNELDSRLMNKFYDSENKYSLPYSWIPYGIIFNKNLFNAVPNEIGLHILFSDPEKKLHGVQKSYRICMTDDSREAIFLAGLYLFKAKDYFTEDQLKSIEQLLVKQKKWVESYVNQDLGYPLLSGLIKAAFAPLFAVDKVLKNSQDFVFMIPSEGSLYSIENIAISPGCKKVALAHKFINFMLSKQEGVRMSNFYGMIPSNRGAYALLSPEMINNAHIFPDDKQFAKLHLQTNDVPRKAFEEIWLAVKSS
ncbi:extracellular solute-binding protein [Candidatus Dependentiae bacterium]|nr:extracellular solute-binding protein [Candidatus Dependentiae bacterium]